MTWQHAVLNLIICHKLIHSRASPSLGPESRRVTGKAQQQGLTGCKPLDPGASTLGLVSARAAERMVAVSWSCLYFWLSWFRGALYCSPSSAMCCWSYTEHTCDRRAGECVDAHGREH
jgi:hypothetical protein